MTVVSPSIVSVRILAVNGESCQRLSAVFQEEVELLKPDQRCPSRPPASLNVEPVRVQIYPTLLGRKDSAKQEQPERLRNLGESPRGQNVPDLEVVTTLVQRNHAQAVRNRIVADQGMTEAHFAVVLSPGLASSMAAVSSIDADAGPRYHEQLPRLIERSHWRIARSARGA
jgi:hypothetical protein